ncbi:tail fiber protein [Cronobacter phage JC01]|uniref:Tail fiber protein n=1 Tax=Cronobacter phage JC01 TaxID=2729575 RepID=A0A6M3YKK9_9CAUD|nr:tail fiber protein [Cronobacter phage JC01]QJI52248.1 tail fiber protein [Cronobacter phage JC01]
MPLKNAPSQGLNYGWVRGEDYWGGPVNDDLIFLDTLLHPVVRSMSFSSPPADAVPGDRFIVAANPTGPWVNHAGDLAALVEGTWVFYKPKTGWRLRLLSTNQFVWYNGDNWQDEVTGDDPVNPGPDPTVKPTAYDIAVTVSDAMYPDEALVHMPLLDAMMLPANMADSSLDMLQSSQVYAQMRVQRNGTNVGTITVEAGSYNATFATAGGNAVPFAKGDRLTIRGPAVAVDAFKNFGFVIRLKFV